MSEDSKPFISSTVRALTLMVAILILLFAVTNWLVTSSENKEFLEGYNEIEPGMPESMVVSLLGTPNDRSTEFYLGQREGFEEAYARAAESGAVRYLMWRRGADVVYAIGFDAAGNVVIIEPGGK